MLIKENKKNALYSLFFAVILAVFGAWNFQAHKSGVSIFAFLVGVLCVIFCVKRLLSKDYIEIFDDGFEICKDNQKLKFNFADIEKIGTKTIEPKKNIQILNFKFRHDFTPSENFKFLRFYGENEATLPHNYEKSFYEICKILKEKFEIFTASNPK